MIKDWSELQRGEKGWTTFWLAMLALTVFNGFSHGYTIIGFTNTIVTTLQLGIYLLNFKLKENFDNYYCATIGFTLCFAVVSIMSWLNYPLEYTP